jgi:hypothetical protein
MRHPERIYFELLKTQIVLRFQESVLDCPDVLNEWNGKTIEQFQKDLQEKVKGRISTRWFYDHLKTEQEDKLPRIDILNLLSEYCNYASWVDFKTANKGEGIVEKNISEPKQKGNWRVPVLIGLALVGALILFIFIPNKKEQREFQLNFVDSDFGMPITTSDLEIRLLNKENGGDVLKADTAGTVTMPITSDLIHFVVEADYYQTDTFEISVGEKKEEKIALKVDDYSVLIHQMSVTSEEDWERRRKQLNGIICNDAVIILVTQDNHGIEMFNKEEFIDLMTMPINALENLKILQTEYRDEKISKMRITQEESYE